MLGIWPTPTRLANSLALTSAELIFFACFYLIGHCSLYRQSQRIQRKQTEHHDALSRGSAHRGPLCLAPGQYPVHDDMKREPRIWNVSSGAVPRQFVLSLASVSCLCSHFFGLFVGIRVFLSVPLYCLVLLPFRAVLCCVKVACVIRSIWA